MSRARNIGRAAAKGIGGTVLAGGVGAIGYGVHGMSSKITAPGGDMSKYPARFWIPGAAMLVAGHVMRRRPKLMLAGAALCGAAGFSIAEGAALAYTIKQNANAQAKAAGTQGLAPNAYDETGAVFSPNDAGALLSHSETVGIGNTVNDQVESLMGL